MILKIVIIFNANKLQMTSHYHHKSNLFHRGLEISFSRPGDAPMLPHPSSLSLGLPLSWRFLASY